MSVGGMRHSSRHFMHKIFTGSKHHTVTRALLFGVFVAFSIAAVLVSSDSLSSFSVGSVAHAQQVPTSAPPPDFAPAEDEFVADDTTYKSGKTSSGGIDENLLQDPNPTGAAEPTTPQGVLSNPLKVDSLSQFLVLILNAVVLIAFPFLVLMLVYAGFLFVQAQGNEQKLQQARRTFLWTLLGALLVLGAQALSLAIKATVEEIRAESGVTEKTNYDFTQGSYSPF